MVLGDRRTVTEKGKKQKANICMCSLGGEESRQLGQIRAWTVLAWGACCSSSHLGFWPDSCLERKKMVADLGLSQKDPSLRQPVLTSCGNVGKCLFSLASGSSSVKGGGSLHLAVCCKACLCQLLPNLRVLHITSMFKYYRLNILYWKCLGPKVFLVFDFFPLDFGILHIYNETP